MVELSATDIYKSFGTDAVLCGVSFSLRRGEKVGVIGRNGAGKTTLLRILTGESEADSGEVFFAKNRRVGYLRQAADFGDGDTPEGILRREYERLCAEGVETYESEIRGILRGMAFPDEMHAAPAERLSGGEKTRLALSALLMSKPDILLHDEPTNHLDIGTIGWLEQWVRSFRGTVVLVTHDRYFLDRTVDRILEIEHGAAALYPGSYSRYAELKRAAREQQLREYEKNRREISRQEELIRRYKERGTEKLAKRAASREKRLEHTERVDKPLTEARSMKLRLDEKTKSGTDVLEIHGLTKSFPARDGSARARLLFEGVDLDLKRGERLCIVGANGIGKTTFLRIALGHEPPGGGSVRRGHNVRMGYYDQEQKFPDSDRTALAEMNVAFPQYSEGEMRTILAAFLFTGDSVFREITALSGGEKAKLALVRLMLSGANTLLLDEPTNHLDIPSREAVEDALLEFDGTLIVVSHDRYFLNKVPTRIAELTRDALVSYPGRYDYYEEKRNMTQSGKSYLRSIGEAEKAGAERADECQANDLTDAAAVRLKKKQAETERKRTERLIAEAEARIEAAEASIAETEAAIASADVASSHTALAEYAEKLDALRGQLEEAYAEWEGLH
ncbi:MAG: ABC-F family ATP-binding cassette domain-containing protein [Clostridiales Family XIII bacterium]|jgi:ATP-binding cassette subfamily F protein 3|nr:ABC-F family ATP-binding cassette domain-containing protein [Clostridiales Family XIII bacterium]